MAGDYGRHYAGIDDPETVDSVHPQPVVHYPRMPSSAHFAGAREVAQSGRHVTGDAGPICVAFKSDIFASWEWYRQQRSVETFQRLRRSYFDRLIADK